MTLEQYWITLVKRWRPLVICIVLLGVAAYIGSRLMTPIYQSTAIVEISFRSGVNQSDYIGLLASDQLVQTESTLATSDEVLRKVASHYPGLTVEELAKEVSAAPKPNTQLFEINVQDPSPTRAAALANDIANTVIQQQVQMQQQAVAQTDSFLYLAQPAQPPLKPVRPDKVLNTAIGLLAGLLLGLSLILLFERLDTHVRTPEAITQLLGWPVLAAILKAEPKEDVINPTGRNANVEPYRILRTNIGFSAIDKPLRTLLVTSASPQDGKSVTAANLAIFMARAGKNTILIDADLRRPMQHELFGIPGDVMGFSNAILAFSMSMTTPAAPSNSPSSTGPLSLGPFLHAVDIPNLCVMPSGPLPPNPPELLDSKAMQSLLSALGNCGAEMVIFDTPPLLGLSDASILASKVDGTLVVADISRANKGQIKQLKIILDQAGANVLGCVVNRLRRSRDHAIYSYYYAAREQTGSNSQRRKKERTTPVTSHMRREPKTQSQQDLLESMGKRDVVHQRAADTPSEPDISARSTINMTSVYPVQPESQSRSDLLNGREGGKA